VSDPIEGARPGPLARLLERLLERRALRWSLVDLCRRTTHEGWEHLRAAEAAGRGVALVTPAGTLWVVAARALAAWAGPLHLAMPAGAADRRLAQLTCGGDGPQLATSSKAITEALSRGARVLFVGSLEVPTEIQDALPFTCLSVVRLRVVRHRRGRYRLVIGRPEVTIK
jgi:hypothetical protein